MDEVQGCEKSNEMGSINRCFSYFTGGIPLKQKVVVVQTPEWKFRANTARNVIFEGY